MYLLDLNQILEKIMLLTQQNGTTEQDVTNKLVKPLLVMLGYSEEWFKYEPHRFNGKVDICIYINGNYREQFFIEIKNINEKLNKHIKQLDIYLTANNIEWGLLTNGIDYILLNRRNGDLDKQEVFRINLLDQECETYLKHIELDSLFNKRTTDYFRDLAQYKNYFLENNKSSSWGSYNNTLTNFFNYLINKYKKYYRLDNERSLDDFKDFILFEINHNKQSNNKKVAKRKATILNKYAHIKGFMDFIVLSGIAQQNKFKNLTEDDMLEGTNCEVPTKNKIPLEADELKQMLDYYKGNSRDSLRNTLILLLTLYAGLDRNEIRTIEHSNIDFKKKVLTIKQREIPLTDKLFNSICDYIELKKEKKLTSNYLFPSNYGNKANDALAEGNFNQIINISLENSKIPKERQKELNIKFLRESLIKRMFNEGFHIEEISYLTGLNLSSLSKYISPQDVAKKVNLKSKLTKRHPYIMFFE